VDAIDWKTSPWSTSRVATATANYVSVSNRLYVRVYFAWLDGRMADWRGPALYPTPMPEFMVNVKSLASPTDVPFSDFRVFAVPVTYRPPVTH
jgi:hypothetical protein